MKEFAHTIQRSFLGQLGRALKGHLGKHCERIGRVWESSGRALGEHWESSGRALGEHCEIIARALGVFGTALRELWKSFKGAFSVKLAIFSDIFWFWGRGGGRFRRITRYRV